MRREVALEGVEVENQGGRVDGADRVAGPGRAPGTHVLAARTAAIRALQELVGRLVVVDPAHHRDEVVLGSM